MNISNVLWTRIIIVQKILSLCLVHINNNIASLLFNMSKKRSVFAVFSVLISGLLLFAIWSNIHVYAQQQPPAQSRAADSLNTTKISSELKAKMCNPGNPSLKVVNATESRICGIPRTVKPHTASAAMPPTSSVSSSAPQQTTTTKPTSVASASTAHPHAKQQRITNTNANVTSQETEGVIGSKIAPATRLTNSLSSSPSSSPSHIAPQVKAVNQPQQQHQTPITRINGTTAVNNTTTGQNYTFTSTTPTSDRIMCLGYPGYKSNPSNHGSSSTDKSGSSPNLKPSNHSTRSATTTTTTADSGSTDKKQSSSATTKSDDTRTINIDDSNPIPKSSHHIRSSNSDTQDSRSTTTKTSGLPSDLASSIKNKVDSIIRNSMKGLIHKTPFILPFH